MFLCEAVTIEKTESFADNAFSIEYANQMQIRASFYILHVIDTRSCLIKYTSMYGAFHAKSIGF